MCAQDATSAHFNGLLTATETNGTEAGRGFIMARFCGADRFMMIQEVNDLRLDELLGEVEPGGLAGSADEDEHRRTGTACSYFPSIVSRYTSRCTFRVFRASDEGFQRQHLVWLKL